MTTTDTALRIDPADLERVIGGMGFEDLLDGIDLAAALTDAIGPLGDLLAGMGLPDALDMLGAGVSPDDVMAGAGAMDPDALMTGRNGLAEALGIGPAGLPGLGNGTESTPDAASTPDLGLGPDLGPDLGGGKPGHLMEDGVETDLFPDEKDPAAEAGTTTGTAVGTGIAVSGASTPTQAAVDAAEAAVTKTLDKWDWENRTAAVDAALSGEAVSKPKTATKPDPEFDKTLEEIEKKTGIHEESADKKDKAEKPTDAPTKGDGEKPEGKEETALTPVHPESDDGRGAMPDDLTGPARPGGCGPESGGDGFVFVTSAPNGLAGCGGDPEITGPIPDQITPGPDIDAYVNPGYDHVDQAPPGLDLNPPLGSDGTIVDSFVF